MIKAIDIKTSLDSLIIESNKIFKLLNEISSSIRKLENYLRENKLHFPFKLKIAKERDRFSFLDLKDEHKLLIPEEDYDACRAGYELITEWSLQWDVDGNCKYRLFLLAEQNEVVFHGSEEFFREHYLEKSTCIFKKPFIETDLKKRLEYSEYLNFFIVAFRDYLYKYRLTIQSNQSLESLQINK